MKTLNKYIAYIYMIAASIAILAMILGITLLIPHK